MHFLLTSSSIWRDIPSHPFSSIAFWAILLRDFPFGAASSDRSCAWLELKPALYAVVVTKISGDRSELESRLKKTTAIYKWSHTDGHSVNLIPSQR